MRFSSLYAFKAYLPVEADRQTKSAGLLPSRLRRKSAISNFPIADTRFACQPRSMTNEANGDDGGTNEERLMIMPIPSLIAVLLNREQEKGAPLTEAEVLAIRDSCECTAVPYDIVPQIVEARGYEDIRAEHAWEDWNAIRPTLTS